MVHLCSSSIAFALSPLAIHNLPVSPAAPEHGTQSEVEQQRIDKSSSRLLLKK